ncbi:MAG: hypothetical protein WCA46_24160 [Actinocatenispora sp.]
MDRDPNDDDPNDPLLPAAPGGADPLLTRVASRLLRTHRADPAHPARCAYPRCHRPYPCDTARLAVEAMTQARCWVGAEQAEPAVPEPAVPGPAAGLIGAAAGDGAS